MKLKFYAGYNSIITDVAIFDDENKRDAWVNDDNTFFERIQLTEEEALEIIGNTYEIIEDIIDPEILWMLNPYNIISK